MPSPRDVLQQALRSKCINSLKSAELLARSPSGDRASAASRVFYSVLQGVACKVLERRDLTDDQLLEPRGNGTFRGSGRGWSFSHGKLVSHADLVVADLRLRRRIKDLEEARNAADYRESIPDPAEIGEQVEDARDLLRALGFNA